MRIGYVISVVGALLLSSGVAIAQPRGGGVKSYEKSGDSDLSESGKQSAKRRASGLGDVRYFGAETKIPEKPFPWMAFGLVLLMGAGLSPVAYKTYKGTRQDLEDQATFGLTKGVKREAELKAEASGQKPPAGSLAELSRRPKSRAGAAAAAPPAGGETRVLNLNEVPADGKSTRDRVWDAIAGAPNWVTAEWVAAATRMSAAETVDELGALVEEGYLQENKDAKGRAVFKAAS